MHSYSSTRYSSSKNKFDIQIMGFKLNKGIPTRSYKQIAVIIALLAMKMIEFASELVGLAITGAALNAKNATLNTAIAASRGRKMSATVDEKTISDDLREDYKTIVTFVEKSINLSGNSKLATDLTLVLSKSKGKVTIAPIRVYNTSVAGKVGVVLGRIKGAHSYIVECSQIDEDGTVLVTFEKTLPLTEGSITGLVQGAKYMFRAHALLTGDGEETWTDYVVLRIS